MGSWVGAFSAGQLGCRRQGPRAGVRDTLREDVDVANDSAIRICSGCGAEYDFRDRRSVGPFHFRIVRAYPGDGQDRLLVDHWRSGVWNEGEKLTLRREDGGRVAVGTGVLEKPPSGTTAYERGQVEVRISAGIDSAMLERGCLWG